MADSVAEKFITFWRENAQRYSSELSGYEFAPGTTYRWVVVLFHFTPPTSMSKFAHHSYVQKK